MISRKYTSLLLKFDSVTDDNEESHKVQDKIYRTFITDIVNNKFKTKQDIVSLAKEMKKRVIKHDKNRWYA